MANTGNSNPGNMSKDQGKTSDAGKKGGQASGGNDRQKTNDANKDSSKKGGQQPSGGGSRS